MRRAANWAYSGNLSENIDIRYIHSCKFTIRSDLGDLSSLMTSIARNGLIQPIIVRPIQIGFEVVCGNRRFEACRKLRLKEIPCIIEHVNDRAAFEKSLIENIERRDLNPIDEARAFRKYVEEFGWGGVSELAKTISKSEEYVSHRILLLDLPEEILSKVSDGSISPSQARELVWMKNANLQRELSSLIVEQKLSVKELRETAKLLKKGVPMSDAISTVSEERSDWDLRYTKEKGRGDDFMLVEKSETILRIAMMRLDGVIELVKDEQTREFLIQERFGIHQLLDECIKRKKEVRAAFF
jgi:ParB family transcriptional regulator, chromosome partitioning protein